MLDTIVAPATPLIASALAIVRIDGPRAVELAEALAGRKLEPRVATHARLTHGADVLDDAVVTIFVEPHSFTGNDSAELTLHGSPYLVRKVVEAALASGARLAEPGEFTERAVLNGKLDLVQAEAVLQLIESRTALQAKLSLSQLDGELSRLSATIRESLLFVISRFEAALDFAEEGYEFVTRAEAERRILSIESSLRAMLGTYSRGHAIMIGLSAVILGQPNAGKSSLMNFLCGSERAIVTEIPGTTRDLLREPIEVAGVPVTIVDTAGLRESDDRVESIGIDRARGAAEGADIVMYLIDASRGETEVDRRELSRLENALVFYTKTDLAEPPKGALGVSVTAARGTDELLGALTSAVQQRVGGTDPSALLVNDRQRAAVARASESLAAALDSLRNMQSEDLVLVDLYAAAESVGSLTGAITHREIMGEIFSRFCIGK